MKDWTGTGTSTFKTIGASNHTEKSVKPMISMQPNQKRRSCYAIYSAFHLTFGSVLVERGIYPKFLRSTDTWSNLRT